MERQQLEAFTRDKQNHGLNERQVLECFMRYQKECKDPLNVFRYMEEKVVCTLMPQYWLQKSFIFAKLGQYSDCFQCLQIARSFIEEDQQQLLELVNQQEVDLRTQMVNEMRKHPLKSKRSALECGANLMDDSVTFKKQKQSDMLKLYEAKYNTLRMKKEEKILEEWSKLPASWLFDMYEKEDQKEHKVYEEKIHQTSTKLSMDRLCHSMLTPMRPRDFQRLTKTLDSVQVAKKRKSTLGRKKHSKEEEEEEYRRSESMSNRYYSMPVGNHFARLQKHRVTFKHEQERPECLREKSEEKFISSKSILRKRRSKFSGNREEMDIEPSCSVDQK